MRNDETPRFTKLAHYVPLISKAETQTMKSKNRELTEKEKMARHLHDTFAKNARDNARGTKTNQANAKKLEKVLLAKLKKEKKV
jgi:hypothetical protein